MVMTLTSSFKYCDCISCGAAGLGCGDLRLCRSQNAMNTNVGEVNNSPSVNIVEAIHAARIRSVIKSPTEPEYRFVRRDQFLRRVV